MVYNYGIIPIMAEYKFEDGRWWYYMKDGTVRSHAYLVTCHHCGEDFPANNTVAYRRKFCGRKCANRHKYSEKNDNRARGETHWNWKGGRSITSNGYVALKMHDYSSSDKNGNVLEHRYVMEQHLGRSLSSRETVHHLNGVRDDNRIENLELWHKKHPIGVRLSDEPHCGTCTCSNK